MLDCSAMLKGGEVVGGRLQPTPMSSPSLPKLASEGSIDTESNDGSNHEHPLSRLGNARKSLLVVIFCVASFVDVCQLSGVSLAVARISQDIHLPLNQIVWASRHFPH